MNTFKCSVASAYAGFVGAFVPALAGPLARAMVLATTFAVMTAIVLIFACAIAGYMLKRRGIKDDGAKPFSRPGGLTVHILACAMIMWLLTSITHNEWMKVGLVLAVATVIFAVTRRRRFVEETS